MGLPGLEFKGLGAYGLTGVGLWEFWGLVGLMGIVGLMGLARLMGHGFTA